MGNVGDVAQNALTEILGKQGNIKANESDFMHDGLLYCGVCRKKKQTRIKIDGISKVVTCICDCEAKEIEEVEKQKQYEEDMRRISRLRSASLIDERLRNASFDSFKVTKENRNLHIMAKRYVDNFDSMRKNSQGLLFWGPVGTGKSYVAACIANELLNRRVSVIMTSFVKILQNVQSLQVDESKLIARLNSAELLIIDDLGTERNTDYALEKVYNIIDSRYLSGKPLILTTNLTLPEMQECQDTRYKRIYDRIFEMCYPYRVSGVSWRIQQAARRFNEMQELLEG